MSLYGVLEDRGVEAVMVLGSVRYCRGFRHYEAMSVYFLCVDGRVYFASNSQRHPIWM